MVSYGCTYGPEGGGEEGGDRRTLRDALEPGDVLPVEAGVDEGADGARGALHAVDLAVLLVRGHLCGVLRLELLPHVLVAFSADVSRRARFPETEV